MLQKVLARYQWLLKKWETLKGHSDAVLLDQWFEKDPTLSCGAIGCVGGWTRHFARCRDTHAFLGLNKLYSHFLHKGLPGEDAKTHFRNMVAGRLDTNLSEWAEGKKRLTTAIKYIEKEVAATQ